MSTFKTKKVLTPNEVVLFLKLEFPNLNFTIRLNEHQNEEIYGGTGIFCEVVIIVKNDILSIETSFCGWVPTGWFIGCVAGIIPGLFLIIYSYVRFLQEKDRKLVEPKLRVAFADV